ncbi:hypothetical protein ACI3KS_05215 [Microbacterium sp. ZW T5_45]|uniref:hypothetical protein n=1 Tax=Microbacterium sp. ZW T5_45 TaxID=3378080 RepID=UPI003853FFD3
MDFDSPNVAATLDDAATTLETLVVIGSVVSEEPDWEYGISYAQGNEEFEGQDLATIQRRVKYIRRQGGYYSRTVRAIRRRPAGDALPVEQEGERR